MKLDSKGTGRIPLDIFSRSDAGSAYEFTECFGAQEYEEQCINLKEDFQTDEFINFKLQAQKFMETLFILVCRIRICIPDLEVRSCLGTFPFLSHDSMRTPS